MKIWKSALDISFLISDVLVKFPKEEQYNLTSKMSRCSISMPSNISEGSARTNKSFSHFIDISLGSSFELYTQILIAQHKKFITPEKVRELEEKIEEWQRMTTSFQNSLDVFFLCSFLFFLKTRIWKLKI